MKYSIQTYLDCDFYSGSDIETNYVRKIVKVRKEVPCSNRPTNLCASFDSPCLNFIAKGTYAYFEKCLLQDEGWVTAYTCLACLDAWIDKYGD